VQVPVLKSQQVAAQPLAAPYQSADVSALSQGGGVAAGVSSIGGVLADEAIKAKKQADQASEFEATADINDFADGLYQDLHSKDGPAAQQAYEQLLPAYDEAVSERLSRITSPEARTAAEQNARQIKANLARQATDHVEPLIWKRSVEANQRLLGSFNKSITLAVSNGGVSASQTPSLPAGVVGISGGDTGSDAPYILDERVIQPYRDAAHAANVKFAEAHPDKLDTDQASYVAHADAIWNEDANASVIKGLLARSDDQTAKAYFEKHKAGLSADDIEDLGPKVENAYSIGTSQRATATAWTFAKGDTISARVAAAKAALPKGLSDKERARASGIIDDMGDGARATDNKTAGDVFDAWDTYLQQGGNATDMTKDATFQWLEDNHPDKARGLKGIANNRIDLAVTDDAVYDEVDNAISKATPEEVGQIDPRTKVGSGLSAKSAEVLAEKIKSKQKLGVGTLSPDEIGSQAASVLYSKDTVSDDDERSKKSGKFKRAYDDAIRWAQSQQKNPVTTDQAKKIADELSASVLMDPSAWRDKSKFGTAVDLSTEMGGVIPPADLVGIVDQIQRAGAPVTREEVLRRYAFKLTTEDWLPDAGH